MIKFIFGKLLKSRKVKATIIGVIIVPLVSYLNAKFGLGLDADHIIVLIMPCVAYIIGQGMADFGKENLTLSKNTVELEAKVLNMEVVEELRDQINDMDKTISNGGIGELAKALNSLSEGNKTKVLSSLAGMSKGKKKTTKKATKGKTR